MHTLSPQIYREEIKLKFYFISQNYRNFALNSKIFIILLNNHDNLDLLTMPSSRQCLHYRVCKQ